MGLNRKLLPIKAHYFLMSGGKLNSSQIFIHFQSYKLYFLAAVGSMLPLVPLRGKQLGVSPSAVGFINVILPSFYILVKPCFGILIDSFPSQRQQIFCVLLLATGASYIMFYLLPKSSKPLLPDNFENTTFHSLLDCRSLVSQLNSSSKEDVY